jgi:tryptophan synthase alpha chain
MGKILIEKTKRMDVAKMNRIESLFRGKKGGILSVYFSAGFPGLDDTMTVLETLAESGADMVEIGMPFSDPVADGPTIQQSNKRALDNGMSLSVLFSQLENFRNRINIPVILMGYFNPVMQYGVEAFCRDCRSTGIDGVILPDLPMDEYERRYRALFDSCGLLNILLITPQTSEERIRRIDDLSGGFVYMVSSASTTGAKQGLTENQLAYFDRINNMGMKKPRLIGFGISDRESFKEACSYAHGAIIGSAFIKVLSESKSLKEDIRKYIQSVKGVKQ